MVGVAAVIGASSASGHHSPIIFDQDSVIGIQGTISRFDWTNPHVYVFVEGSGPTGDVVEWQLETDATPILLRNGWTRESLQPGDRVSARANPDRMAARAHGLLVEIEKTDGTILSPTGGLPGGALPGGALPGGALPDSAATSLAGHWEQRFESFARLNASVPTIAVTDEGAAARAGYDIRTDNPMARCIPYPPPVIVGLPQYVNEIEILDDRVIFRMEFYGVERVVYTDGRSHSASGERTVQGHSIGRWEADNVLVVDTALFADHRSTFPGSGLSSGADKHVLERYALSADGTRIVIDFTLEDPEFLAEPFSGTLVWHHAPHLDFSPFGCDSGQATRFMREPPRSR